MAGVTLNQIAVRISQEQGDRTGDASFVSQCETWLKSAMVEIDSEANFKAFFKNLTITTDPGNTTGLYDLPEDFRSIKYLRLADTDDPIDYENPSTLIGYNVDLEQRGRPSIHWISDPRIDVNKFIQRVRFHPIPNVVLPVDGKYYFDVINTASSDILPLTSQAINALESRLRMYIRKADENWTAYNVERSEYSKHLAILIKSEVNKPSRRMKGRVTDLPSKSRRPSRLRYPFEA